MKRIVLFLLIFLFAQLSQLKAVEFSVKEKSVIDTDAVNVLNDYQTILNQMGESVVNDIEKAKSAAESFLELFGFQPG